MRVFKFELFRLIHFRSQNMILGFYLLTLAVMTLTMREMSSIWQSLTLLQSLVSLEGDKAFTHLMFFTGYLETFLGFAIVSLGAAEVQTGVLKQHVIDGFSPLELWAGKVIYCLFLMLFQVIVVLSLGFLFGNFPDGVIGSFPSPDQFGGFLLRMFGSFSLMTFFILIFRRAVATIGFFLFYAVVLEKVVASIVSASIGHEISGYMPKAVFNTLVSSSVQLPGVEEAAANYSWSIGYILLIWVLSFLIIKYKQH